MMSVQAVARATKKSLRTVQRWAQDGRHPDGHGVWSVPIGDRVILIAAVMCECGTLVWLRPSIKARGMYIGQCSMCGTELISTIGGKSEAI